MLLVLERGMLVKTHEDKEEKQEAVGAGVVGASGGGWEYPQGHGSWEEQEQMMSNHQPWCWWWEVVWIIILKSCWGGESSSWQGLVVMQLCLVMVKRSLILQSKKSSWFYDSDSDGYAKICWNERRSMRCNSSGANDEDEKEEQVTVSSELENAGEQQCLMLMLMLMLRCWGCW
jgi:hypothetical protein